MARRILILAGDTDGNLGDLAIVTATCQELRRSDPSVEISLVTSQPQRDADRLGIQPIKRGFPGASDLLATARKADHVICGGGGLFQDDDSLVKMPYWAIRLFLIRMLSAPITGLSIGAGPLHYRISRLFARVALQQLDPISVRDAPAQSTLMPLTRKTVEVVPDPAFLLDAAPESQGRSTLQESGVPIDQAPLIGVAVRRWFHKSSSLIPYKYASKLGLQKNRGLEEMSAFIDLVAAALNAAVEGTNAHVVFMPTYDVEHEADIEVCRAVASKMDPGQWTILQLDDPCLYKSVTGLLSAMVCGRMHAAILAAGQGTPIVGLAYNPKFSGMFSLVEQDNRCLSINEFVKNDLSDQLTAMLLAAIREPSKYRPDTSEIERRTRNFIEKIVAPIGTAR
jgi:polysaccharide pyruvyl transferase WcaK-like protein